MLWNLLSLFIISYEDVRIHSTINECWRRREPTLLPSGYLSISSHLYVYLSIHLPLYFHLYSFCLSYQNSYLSIYLSNISFHLCLSIWIDMMYYLQSRYLIYQSINKYNFIYSLWFLFLSCEAKCTIAFLSLYKSTHFFCRLKTTFL